MMYLLSEHEITRQKLDYWRLPSVHVIHAVAACPDTAILIVKLAYHYRNLHAFRAISRRPGPWGLHRVQCLPTPVTVKRWLCDAIPPWLLGIRHADFVICAGSVSTDHPLIGPTTERIWTDAPDVFRASIIGPRPWTNPYAIFLDEWVDHPHPDYRALGISPPDAWAYRFEMDRLIKQVEYNTGLTVHWADRVNGHTPTLIAHADLVLGHSSTAFSFAVLMNKPTQVLIPDCFRGRFEEQNALAMRIALQDYDGYKRKYLYAAA